MKTRIVIINALLVLSLFVVSCGVDSAEYDKVKKENDSYKAKVVDDSVLISALRDTISMLSISSEQRLSKVNSLISSGEYSEAKKEMRLIVKLFPQSKEAQSSSQVLQRIDDLIAKKKAEEERMKALGFKGLKTVSSVTIGYNKVSFSNISVGNTFVFDSYDDEWWSRKADRGNVYVTAVMSVTSTSHDPKLPTLAVYSIKGDEMVKEGVMTIEFARWSSYGHYLGNYSDYKNDFAKTSTIRFKLGVEVSENVTKGPYAVVLKKSNELSRSYDRFDNPPVSYTGHVSYPYTLKLINFTGDNSEYVVVKIANL